MKDRSRIRAKYEMLILGFENLEDVDGRIETAKGSWQNIEKNTAHIKQFRSTSQSITFLDEL